MTAISADAVPPRDRDRGGRPGRRVGADVRKQVVDDLAQADAVADDDRALGVELDRAVPGRRPARSRPPRRRPRRARTGSRSSGRPSSRRASRRRSSTRTLIRSDSRLIPLIERSRSSGRSAAPRSYSSAYARTADSGVRSSCDASATKRRSLRSDASCARNDDSIRPSIAFSARPRRPTSVRSSARSTLRERSPAAIAEAVSPIASSGRRPSRTSQRPSADDRTEHERR